MYPFTCCVCGLPGFSRSGITKQHERCYRARERHDNVPKRYPFVCAGCGCPGTSTHRGRKWHWKCWATRNAGKRDPHCEHCGGMKTSRYQDRFCGNRCRRDHEASPSFNPHYFADDTPRVAYHAGMLLADGNVLSRSGEYARLTIKLKAGDREYTDLLREDLGAFHCTVRLFAQSRRLGAGPMVQFAVSHPDLVRDLRRWGVVPRKTTEPVVPQEMDDDLVPHFLRGLIDGDGCIGLYRPSKGCAAPNVSVRIACHPVIASWVESVCPWRPNTSKQVPTVNVPFCCVSWGAWNRILPLLRWLGYEDLGLPALSRKRNKVLQVLAAGQSVRAYRRNGEQQ